MSDYTDSRGRTFANYRESLPTLASNFPHEKPIRERAAVAHFRGLEISQRCWACGRANVKLDLHHIIGGAGRSDERCNMSILCGGLTPNACHPRANTDELPMGFILFRKWLLDQTGTDWARLAVLRGSFLPYLIHGCDIPRKAKP